METIDVHDLPDEVARAIAETVENLRAQARRREQCLGPVVLLTMPLGVKTRLTREEIYDDLLK